MSASTSFSNTCSSFLQSLFPIKDREWGLFIPLFCMFYLISFSYSFLRTSKDVLVIARGGAEILSALKLYFVLPSAVLYTAFYAKLCNRVAADRVFYYALSPFFIYYFLFYMIFIPYECGIPIEYIQEFLSSIGCSELFIRSTQSFWMAIAHWPFSLYYVMAELWGSAAMSLLFWGLANSLVSLSQAKRMYALLGIGANLGLMTTGPYIHRLGLWSQHYYPLMIDWLMVTFFISFLCICGLYAHIEKKYRYLRPIVTSAPVPDKEKLSWFEAVHIVSRSRQLILIAILVMSYGFSINLVEIVWKSQVTHYFLSNASDPLLGQAQMQEFSAHTNTVMGFLSIILIIFVSTQAERFLGWTATALMTPVTLLAMGLIFFMISYCAEYPLSWLGISVGSNLWTDPLYVAILVGALQNAISKAAKYSLFDPTKEKAYFPLTHEERTKGKSAVDVLGARLGKALGALTQQIIIIGFGSLSLGFYWLGLFVAIACFIWMFAAIALGRSLAIYEQRIHDTSHA